MRDRKVTLPFKVGQLAESRSFLSGYRGAWFRCSIKEISRKKGGIGLSLEYYDFPDEKIEWTKLYQKPPLSRFKPNEERAQLMVRPAFPHVCRERELPDISEISEVMVVVNDAWKVGDLVDWWTDGCFWSGRITQILSEEKVQVQLPPPPLGEGLCYSVYSKDLRPSLDWSLEVGWTVAIPTEPENYCPFARIIKPVNQVAETPPNSTLHAVDEGRKDVQDKAVSSSVEPNASLSSHTSAAPSSPFPDKSELSLSKELPEQPSGVTVSKQETHVPDTKVVFGGQNRNIGRTSLSDSASSSVVRDAPDGMETAQVGDEEDEPRCKSRPSKKTRTVESMSLNSMHSDSLEASIVDLEELANKVRWLRGILDFGNPDAIRPPLKFMEHRPSAAQK